MRVNDVIKKFVKMGNRCSASNLVNTGDRLIHYSTTIAQYHNGVLYFNRTKYSHSTSKIQNELLKQLNNTDNVIILHIIEGVEWETYDLIPA